MKMVAERPAINSAMRIPFSLSLSAIIKSPY
jgi:hypothetical protein